MEKGKSAIRLNEIMMSKSDFNPDSVLSKLKDNGVLIVDGFLNQSFIEELKMEFNTILQSESSDFLAVRPYSLGKAALLTRNENMKKSFEMSYNFFSSPFMQDLTNRHLGTGYLANEKIFVVKDVIGSKHHANDLHFDVQRTLKFFLYLNDTSEKNGAFRCVPGSHKITADIRKKNSDKISYENREFSRMLPFSEKDTISVDGKAGSLIIFDTDVFHQTGSVSEGERWVMRGQSEPVPSTLSKVNSLKPTFLEKLKRKLFS